MSVHQTHNASWRKLVFLLTITATMSWVASRIYYKHRDEVERKEIEKKVQQLQLLEFWKNATMIVTTLMCIILTFAPIKKIIKGWLRQRHGRMLCAQRPEKGPIARAKAATGGAS